MSAALTSERDWRGPGCDERCVTVRALVPGQYGRRDLLLHDPRAHEAYGQAVAVPPAPTGIIVTGDLGIDLDRALAQVDGRAVALTPTELTVLICLAQRLDRMVASSDLIVRVWGVEYLSVGQSARHALRVTISRLRRQLGPAAGLLLTVRDWGYRLLAAPGRISPERWPTEARWQVRTTAWSPTATACRRCGLTRRPHGGRGYCTSCRSYAMRHGLEPYGTMTSTQSMVAPRSGQER